MRFILFLLALPLCGGLHAEEPLAPATIPLPVIGIDISLGMSHAQIDSALIIWPLEHAGEERGRVVYQTDIAAPLTSYTLQAVLAGDSLIELSVTALDSGAVERWFRGLVDRLPLYTTYEQHTDADEIVTERWTTYEAVWSTEHPLRPDPETGITYWEIRRR